MLGQVYEAACEGRATPLGLDHEVVTKLLLDFIQLDAQRPNEWVPPEQDAGQALEKPGQVIALNNVCRFMDQNGLSLSFSEHVLQARGDDDDRAENAQGQRRRNQVGHGYFRRS